MEIERRSPTELAVRFTSNPDAAKSQEWVDQVKTHLEGKEELIVVDLRELEVVSSLGVSVVVGIYKNLEKQGGKVKVLVPNERMRHVFELFRLTKFFDVEIVEGAAS